MKGIDLARDFFLEWGLPTIRSEFPHLEGRVAAGRFGGSDVLEADDELSQDHDWGPMFELFIPDDYELPDEELKHRLCSKAPEEFKGFRRQGGYDSAVHIRRTRTFFEGFLGLIPETEDDWATCRNLDAIESFLYFLRHGALFHDGDGKFSQLRAKFSSYPKEILRLRIASAASGIAHFGEYNFCERLVKRGDPITMQIAIGRFTEVVMKMYFYLDGDFTPYWKWLAFEFRKRAYSTSIADRLSDLPRLSSTDQAEQVLMVCGELKQNMIKGGIVPADLANPYGMPWFFLYKRYLLDTIENAAVRKMLG